MRAPRVHQWVAPKHLTCEDHLTHARAALRRSDLNAAEGALLAAAPCSDANPAFHNLRGLLHECRGHIRHARKAYGLAIAASPSYWPAQLNMRRLYELDALGRTTKLPALGDESAT